MLFSLPTANRALASAARISLTVMLLLTLLSSVAPFGSLASHRCQMVCCAGKPGHAEGSCGVAFLSEENREADDHQGEEHSAHNHTQHAAAHQSSSKRESGPGESLAPQVITTPCSPECAAAASASTRSQRPRESAAITSAAPLRPPGAPLFKRDYFRTLRPSALLFRQLRPRAPPPSPVNLSA